MKVLTLHQENINTESITQVFKRVYEPGFLQVAKYISKNGGTFEDAKDIFHDALVIYYEQYKTLKSIQSEVNYITGIAKHLWLRQFKKDVTNLSLAENQPSSILPDEPSLNEQKLLSVLERTGKKCLELLTAYYSDKISLTKILSMFNFSSEHSASVQKHKCIEKIREFIKHKSIAYEDFFE